MLSPRSGRDPSDDHELVVGAMLNVSSGRANPDDVVVRDPLQDDEPLPTHVQQPIGEMMLSLSSGREPKPDDDDDDEIQRVRKIALEAEVPTEMLRLSSGRLAALTDEPITIATPPKQDAWFKKLFKK